MSYKPAFQNKPHVHCELIKAWADGASIQKRVYSISAGDFIYSTDPNPNWDKKGVHYRIKPNEPI